MCVCFFFFSCTLKLHQSACRKSDVMRVGGVCGGVVSNLSKTPTTATERDCITKQLTVWNSPHYDVWGTLTKPSRK